MRVVASLVVVLLTSGCGRPSYDCFCGPGLLMAPELVDLGPVPRGCGRVDRVALQNRSAFGTSPPMRVIDVTTSDPRVTVTFPSTEIVEIVDLQLTVDVPLDAPERVIETDVQVTTDTGNPRITTFRVRAQVVTSDDAVFAPIDFGGMTVGRTAVLPFSLVTMSPQVRGTGFTKITGDSFDYAKADEPTVELRFSPSTTGAFVGALELEPVFTCAGHERLTVLGNGVPAMLVASPSQLDFGTVNVGSTATRSVVIDNFSTRALTPIASRDSDFLVTTTTLSPATRDSLGELHAGQTTLEVQFAPRSTGAQTLPLDLRADTLAGPVAIPLSVTGVGQ